MPYQQVFELKDSGLVHGSTIVDQSVNLGVKGMPGTLDENLFPQSLDLRANELKLDRLLLEAGSVSKPSLGFRNSSDTGLFLVGSSLAFAAGGSQVFQTSSGSNRSFVPFKIPDGSTSVPGLHFASDTDVGLFLSGASMGLVSAGVQAFQVASSANRSFVPLKLPDGSTSVPALHFADDTDVGIFRSGGSLGLVSSGTQTFQASSFGNRNFVALKLIDGSTSVPGLHFASDTNTGLMLVATDTLGLVAGGTLLSKLTSTQIRIPDGGAATPLIAFDNDLDTGIYRVGTNTLGIASAGSAALWVSVGQLRAPNGAVGSPAHSFINDSDTGMYLKAGNELSFATGGVERLHVNWDGTVDIVSGTLHIGGVNHGSASGSHVTNGNSHNHSGGDGAQINHGTLSGLDDTGDHTWAIIDGGSTTASANTWFGGARSIKVVSSQLKNKTSISPLLTTDEHPQMVPAERRAERQYPFSVLDLTPIQFKSLLDGDDGRLVRTGFLWEDVDENYPAGTQDESLDVNALIAGLVAEVKQLRQEVNELKGNHGDS